MFVKLSRFVVAGAVALAVQGCGVGADDESLVSGDESQEQGLATLVSKTMLQNVGTGGVVRAAGTTLVANTTSVASGTKFEVYVMSDKSYNLCLPPLANSVTAPSRICVIDRGVGQPVGLTSLGINSPGQFRPTEVSPRIFAIRSVRTGGLLSQRALTAPISIEGEVAGGSKLQLFKSIP